MNKSTYNRLKSINRSVALGAIALAAIVALFPAVGVATPPEGIVSATVFAGPAGFADPTDLKLKINKRPGQEVISVKNSEDTVIQQVIIAPAGHTGWHSHPGPVVVLIKSGTLSFYDGDDPTCTVRTYAAGEAFIDSGQGHVHIARNEGSENLELWATYFDVPADGIFRIDAPSPGNCPF
jgi:quercetin dioxygenase-like cupin family protein